MRTAGSIVVVVVSATLFPEAHDETKTDTAIALNNGIFIWFFRFNQLTKKRLALAFYCGFGTPSLSICAIFLVLERGHQ